MPIIHPRRMLLQTAAAAALAAGRMALVRRRGAGHGAHGERSNGRQAVPLTRRDRPGAHGGDPARLHVQTKSNPRDLVTQLDVAAETLLREHLVGTGVPIYGEEAGFGDSGEAGGDGGADGDTMWMVDPIDGTTNFVHGLPHFGVSVALVEAGRPTLAVFYDPTADELFLAAKGEGCRLVGGATWEHAARERAAREHAAEAGAGADGDVFADLPVDSQVLHVDDHALAQALVGTSFPNSEAERRHNTQSLIEVGRHCRSMRALGSAATHLAYVAAGRMSACWDVRLAPWDMAGGWLMVEEAGGVVRAVDGSAFRLDQPTIVAGNPAAHGDLLRVLQTSRARAADS